MAAKLVECEHCGGQGTCTASGGKSCAVCLQAAGKGKKGWNVVRCSFCGGIGRVWVEQEEEEEEQDVEQQAQEEQEQGADEETQAEAD